MVEPKILMLTGSLSGEISGGMGIATNEIAKHLSSIASVQLIKSGNENDLAMPVITSFMTDSIGNFSIHLTPGIYSIVVKEQLTVLNAADFDTKKLSVDKDCLAAWWKKPYYLLEVKQENISTLNFVFHHRCNIKYDIPCISYHGPLAP